VRPLNITILGGTGFVGTRLVSRLARAGHTVTVLTRNRERHKHLLVLPQLALNNCDVYDVAVLADRCRGADVVINMVGILNEHGFGGGGFRRAHTEFTRNVLQACRSANVPRLLQVSSLGAAPDAPSHYLRSKGEAEQLIQSSGLSYTIFKPSVLFGPGDSFLNRFAQLLGAIPLIFPLARAQARFQPVYVDDLIEAIVRRLQPGIQTQETLELGGPDIYTLREILVLVAKLTGRRRWIMGLPGFIGRMQAFMLNFVPGRPFSSDNYKSMLIDSVCSQNGFAAVGIEPQAMPGIAATYLGAAEDNNRLSELRAQAGHDAATQA
jgi:NADH dehydrogenase